MAIGMPPSETELLSDGIKLARASLDVYGVLDDEHWKTRQNYASLDPQRQAELDQRLAQALYLVANAAASLAERSDGPAKRDDCIQQALQLNTVARNLLPPKLTPRDLYDQQVGLLELAGATEKASTAREHATASSQDTDLGRYAEILKYHSKRDYRGAIPLLKELRDLNPEDPASWLFLGNATAALGYLHESEGYFTAAVALGPDSFLGYYNRGLRRLELQQFEEARSDFDQVVVMKPQLACGYLNRAVALRALDRHEEAIDDLTRALELGAPQTRIYFLRAELRNRLGDKSGAADDIATGLSLTPTDELSWVSRGVAQLKTDPKAALSDFRRALALNPLSPTALRNCVHVLADQLDQPDQALDVLNQLLAINAEDPNALAGRAVLFARQGERTAAIADVQKLLQVSKEPKALFQAACALSLTSTVEPKDVYKALTMLTRAVTASPVWLARAKTDPDLANLRATEEYADLLKNVKELTKLNIELYRKSASTQATDSERP